MSYMLEQPKAMRTEFSDNRMDTTMANQQERPGMPGILNDYTLDTLTIQGDDIVWSALRDAESSRNDCSLVYARVTNIVHARSTGVL